MGSMINGEKWEVVAERRARKLAVKAGCSEDLWELFLLDANTEMLKELSMLEGGTESKG